MNEIPNPYSPPQSEVGAVAPPSEPIVFATKGRRFGTLIVDYAMFMTLSFIIGIAIALLFGEAGHKAIQEIPDFVLGFPIFTGYYVFFEGIWARTPGKFLFGTVVVSESGAKPSFGQVMGRTLCRFIPFEAFSFFGARGWHDSIPKTAVVMKQSL